MLAFAYANDRIVRSTHRSCKMAYYSRSVNMKIRKSHLFLLLAVWLTFGVKGFSQNAANDVHVRLLLGSGQTRFRIGEPIIMVLAFTADRGNYSLNTVTTTPASPIDDVT